MFVPTLSSSIHCINYSSIFNWGCQREEKNRSATYTWAIVNDALELESDGTLVLEKNR